MTKTPNNHPPENLKGGTLKVDPFKKGKDRTKSRIPKNKPGFKVRRKK